MYSDPDSAFVMASELIAYSQKRDYLEGEAGGLNYQGIIRGFQGNYPKALEYYERSLRIQEESGDQKGISAVLNNAGLIYNKQGNYTKALEYFQRSLRIKQEIGDKHGISINLNNIGLIYKNQGNYPKALEYYERALKIKKEIGDEIGISSSLNNIGFIYRNQGDHHKALEYFQRSLKIKEKEGHKRGISGTLNNIGVIHKDQGNYRDALEYYTRSLNISKEIGDKSLLTINLNSIGLIHQLQGNSPKALEYCKQGLTLAEETGALERQLNACQCLYDTYKSMEQGNEALVYLEKMRVVEDSLNFEETTKMLQQMEFAKQVLSDSIDTAEKVRLVEDAHQEEVRQKNQNRNVAYGFGGLILLLAVSLYSRLRFVRRSKANLQVEKDRSENLLLNILPADIAAELKAKGKADARDYETVSILFTDFKEFTQTSEKLSAQELVSEINICYEAFDQICVKHHIEKIKTIGDSYMAAGGLPVPSEDSVKNTVLAALEMQTYIINRKIELDTKDKLAFEMRVGIHTGPVVAGIVGIKKFQYDIWGDTVNTASRIESNGEAGKVNISRSTYDLLNDDLDLSFERRGKIETKGKGEIEMFFVSKP